VGFDQYSGTISQIVERIVNNLTSTNQFTVVATWGTTYKWYALQYTDPDGVTANNQYIIIGPHTMRATARSASIPHRDYITCSGASYWRGRPYNFYGISVIVTPYFDPSTFTVTSAINLKWTYLAHHLRWVQTRAVSPTACNDGTVPQTYEDTTATAYMYYDRYGFVVATSPSQVASTAQTYTRLAYVAVVYRLRPTNPNLSVPDWWVVLNDQATYVAQIDTDASDISRNMPYPSNLCTYTWTTSGGGFGLCADAATAYNMSPAVTSLVSLGAYPTTINVAGVRSNESACATPGSTNRAPTSLYAAMTFGRIFKVRGWPAVRSSLDGNVYMSFPAVAADIYVNAPTYASVDKFYGTVDLISPISPDPSGISMYDMATLPDGRQYIAIEIPVATAGNVGVCYGGYDTGDGYNTHVLRYFIKYA